MPRDLRVEADASPQPPDGHHIFSSRDEPVGKTCCDCRTDRPIAAFFPYRFTTDGYSGRCRACVAAAAQRDRAERERRRSTFKPKTRSRCAASIAIVSVPQKPSLTLMRTILRI